MRLRVPLLLPMGIGLILLGVGGRAAIEHWMSTRIVRPVNIPVSLAPGHIRTGPFRLNLDADYWVGLNPGTDWRWDATHPECDPYRHLQTRWTLYKNGNVVDRLDQPIVLPWPSGFRAGPGVYELDVEVMSDFHCLDPLPPHLEVVANTENYETAALFVRAGLAIVTYIGIVWLTFLPMIQFVHSFEHSETVTETASAGKDFQWARKLPLRSQISGLPSFGVVGGIIYALVAMLMMMLIGFGAPRSKGLRVALLKQGTVPQKSHAWTEPLIVEVKDSGAGRPPNLYVNSRLVAWEDFDRVLKQELSRRREWVVYVGGDDMVAWQHVVNLIDVARGDHARVYLITGTTRISR
jgi:biopolymer transport protein ExbD